MRISHIFIYGDNLNSLCDFYSFVFDCEVDLSAADPCIVFENYKFVFKKVLGKRHNILPAFSLELNTDEYNALLQRLSLFYYKAQQEFNAADYKGDIIEISDPCDNILTLVKTDNSHKSEQTVRNC